MTNSRRLGRRAIALASVAAAAATVGIGIPPAMPPLVLYNRTPSLPIGWYVLLPGRTPARGDIVAFTLPPAAWSYARRRGEPQPSHMRLLKHVLAIAGDHVSTRGCVLSVNGVAVGRIATGDDAGRALPHWRGDGVLSPSDLLVGSADPHSFDSRYFGPIDATDVQGVYGPLRVRDDTSRDVGSDGLCNMLAAHPPGPADKRRTALSAPGPARRPRD